MARRLGNSPDAAWPNSKSGRLQKGQILTLWPDLFPGDRQQEGGVLAVASVPDQHFKQLYFLSLRNSQPLAIQPYLMILFGQMATSLLQPNRSNMLASTRYGFQVHPILRVGIQWAMDRQTIFSTLSSHEAELRGKGVVSLSLFGSVARNETGADSDVDLLVEFDRTVSLFEIFDLQYWLEELLDLPKVDLVQKTALHPALKANILTEAIHII